MAKRTMPPTDKAGELEIAIGVIRRCRRDITEARKGHDKPLPLEWQHYIADCLKEGLPDLPAE